jgi:hypothetical protein
MEADKTAGVVKGCGEASIFVVVKPDTDEKQERRVFPLALRGHSKGSVFPNYLLAIHFFCRYTYDTLKRRTFRATSRSRCGALGW